MVSSLRTCCAPPASVIPGLGEPVLQILSVSFLRKACWIPGYTRPLGVLWAPEVSSAKHSTSTDELKKRVGCFLGPGVAAESCESAKDTGHPKARTCTSSAALLLMARVQTAQVSAPPTDDRRRTEHVCLSALNRSEALTHYDGGTSKTLRRAQQQEEGAERGDCTSTKCPQRHGRGCGRQTRGSGRVVVSDRRWAQGSFGGDKHARELEVVVAPACHTLKH